MLIDFPCRNVLSIDEYASYFDGIDPLVQYKTWTTKQAAKQSSTLEQMSTRDSIHSQRVKAAFIVSDSVDWSRDIQVALNLCVICLFLNFLQEDIGKVLFLGIDVWSMYTRCTDLFHSKHSLFDRSIRYLNQIFIVDHHIYQPVISHVYWSILAYVVDKVSLHQSSC